MTSDNVYSEIQQDLIRPIYISSLMASNTFLIDWVLDGEKDEMQIRKYLKKIYKNYNAFTSFFVSEKTRIYYHYNGILKKINSDDIRDKWYFRVQKMDAAFEANVDPDMANKDTMTIFVNHKVFDYNGEFIGAAGIGLEVGTIKKLIYEYQQKYKRDIYFIDKNGMVLLQAGEREKTLVNKNINSMEGISSIAGKILSAKKSILSFDRNGKKVHLNSRYIPELCWYLLVEQTEEVNTEQILKVFIINFILSIIVSIIVILLINFILNAYRKKLANLVEDDEKLRKINLIQEEEISKQNKVLIEKNEKLQDALDEVKKLSGYLPICASCKNIRDDKGYWNQIEEYISQHSEVRFSHGICPKCKIDLYPEFYKKEE